MLEFYFWPTPNTWKVAIMLQECGLPYEVIPVNISAGEQFAPEFLAISPNNRIPALVDPEAEGGPISIFESGAILMYLAEKTGRFMPADLHQRYDVLQWLYWQVGNLGPMAGQLGHFRNYSEERIEYALQRYGDEYNRLLGVLNRGLEGRDYLAGDYSIADMATWPWVRSGEYMEQPLEEFPNVIRWFREVGERPGVKQGFALGMDWFGSGPPKAGNEKANRGNKNLFGHTAKAVAELSKKAADKS
jgi:GST-like protein